jgi:hypothetical protein
MSICGQYVVFALWHHWEMRTTLSLDDDVLQEIRSYATTHDISIGRAVSDLVRRGLPARLRTRIVNGFHVVELPLGSPVINSEDVKRLDEE